MTIRPGARLIWVLGAMALWSLLSLVWPATAWLIPPLLVAATT